MRLLLILAVALATILSADAYCNLKTYKAYLKKQEVTCGSAKSTYCDKECHKSITQWIMYSDGCVAPNENSLPHPFLDDNGINPVYQKDLHEMKVRFKHYCGKVWIGAASTSAPAMLFISLVTTVAAAAAAWAR
mmetsp:Transcript_1817/g.3768  ORF Transcript_1817/g.3768 Transcript_1817/m.3768 type:complete len:134 (+) Transcript_1817:22-423(+)